MAKKTEAKRRRRKYRFTKEDCRRGFQAALAKCMEDWNLLAWLYERVRRSYRGKERDSNGTQKEH